MTKDDWERLRIIKERLVKVVYLVPAERTDSTSVLLDDARWLAARLDDTLAAATPKEVA